ncbi:MAG: O-antigen ligase family protein [Phycisphaerae bacterium]|nr:O-antigen ligase family protein [Phycisphaerae bacterium]
MTRPAKPAARIAVALRWCALAILLVLACLRMMLLESLHAPWTIIGSADADTWTGPTPATSMAFAAWIAVAWLLWAIAQWRSPQPVVGKAGLAFIALFAVAAAVSFTAASNKAAARNTSVQLLGYLASFWLLLQLLATRRLRQAALAAVLTAGLLFAGEALLQRYYENPYFVNHVWPEKRAELFKSQGWSPDDPQARQYEERVRSSEVKGFALNANMAAALLLVVVLAGVGWGVQKLAASKGADQRAGPSSAPPSAVSVSRMFAILALVSTAICLFALLLTKSRGGIISTLFALSLFAILAIVRGWAARHWRSLLTATAGILIAVAAVATVAAARMTQPAPDSIWYRNGAAQSLLVRWHYWRGAAAAVRDAPLTGIGGGNFSTAYQRHKPEAALEDVDNPHNFVLSALVEFGPLGAMAVVGLLAWVVASLVRQRCKEASGIAALGTDAFSRRTEGPRDSRPDPRNVSSFPRTLLFFVVVLPPVVAALRVVIQWPQADPVSNAAIAILGPLILLMLLTSRDRIAWPDDLGEGWVQLAIGAGLAGFLLACTIDFGLIQAAPATAFWTLSAIALAGRLDREPKPTPQRKVYHAIAVVASAGSAAFIVGWAYVPVAAAEDAMRQVARGGWPAGAVESDPLDPDVPEYMASALSARAGETSGRREIADLYQQAWRRDLANAFTSFRWVRAALDVPGCVVPWDGGKIRRDDITEVIMQAALSRAPRSIPLWRGYGELLVRSDRYAEAANAFAHCLAIDDVIRRRDPKGHFRLSDSARKDLEERLAQARAHQPRAPTTAP